MALGDLSSREAVLEAIAEFDEVGEARFLERYGYGPALRWVLKWEGRDYPSKAIAGVAYSKQYPDRTPLRETGQFSGGEQSVVKKLRELEFDVEPAGQAIAAAPADGVSGTTIRDSLEAILAGYQEAATQPFGRDSPLWGTFQRVASRLEAAPPVGARPTVHVAWSAGRGNWARVPWIAFLDERETTTTQHGVYPVLLFRQDMTGLYLTLAQGVTEPRRGGRSAAVEHLRSVATSVRQIAGDLPASGFTLGSDLSLSPDPGLGRDYELSTVAYKFYGRGSVPADSQLTTDIEAVLSVYDRYIDHRPSDPGPAPSGLVIYVGTGAAENLRLGLQGGIWGFTTRPDAFDGVRPGQLVLLGTGYSGGSPRVSKEQWADHELERLHVGRITRGPYEDEEPFWPDESGEKRYPYRLRFESLRTHENVALAPGQDLGDAVVEGLRVSAVDRGRGRLVDLSDSPLLEGTEDVAPTSDIAELQSSFAAVVERSGLVFDEEHSHVVSAFFSALLTKPFVILTGLSGSGKTQLAMRFGEWLGTDAAGRPRFKVLAVRPDWTGPEPLFGYQDAIRSAQAGRPVWHVPEALEFMYRAHEEPTRPHLLVLDEMNLAHVERYFADFLSAVESRQPVLPDLGMQGGEWVSRSEDDTRVALPPNLVVVGTVNVDETTYMFSPKVLDRASTFEMRVSADALRADAARPTPGGSGTTADLAGFALATRDDNWHVQTPHPEAKDLSESLRDLHRLLAESGHEFGHRTFYEALRFAAFFSAAGVRDSDVALDRIVMQKLLPRLHGSRRRIEQTLLSLQEFAAGSGHEPGAGHGSPPRLPVSHAKVSRMVEVLRANQFVSFTE